MSADKNSLVELKCEGYDATLIGEKIIPMNLLYPLGNIYPYAVEEGEEFMRVPSYVMVENKPSKNNSYNQIENRDSLMRISDYITEEVLKQDYTLGYSGETVLLSLKQRPCQQYSLSNLAKTREPKPVQLTSETLLVVPKEAVSLVNEIVGGHNGFIPFVRKTDKEPNNLNEDFKLWKETQTLGNINAQDFWDLVHGWGFVKTFDIIKFLENDPFNAGYHNEMIRFIQMINELMGAGCPTYFIVTHDDNWSTSISGCSNLYHLNTYNATSSFSDYPSIKFAVKTNASYENEKTANLFKEFVIGKKIDKLHLASFVKTYGITTSTQVRPYHLWTEFLQSEPILYWLQTKSPSKQNLINMLILLIDDFYKAQNEGLDLYIDTYSLSVQTLKNPLKFLLTSGRFVILKTIFKVHKFSFRPKTTPLMVNVVGALGVLHLLQSKVNELKRLNTSGLFLDIIKKIAGNNNLKTFYSLINQPNKLTTDNLINLDTLTFLSSLHDLAGSPPVVGQTMIYDITYKTFNLFDYFQDKSVDNRDYTAARVMLALQTKLGLEKEFIMKKLKETVQEVVNLIFHEIETIDKLSHFAKLESGLPNRILQVVGVKLYNASISLYDLALLNLLTKNFVMAKYQLIIENPLFMQLTKFAANKVKTYNQLDTLFNCVEMTNNNYILLQKFYAVQAAASN